MKRPFTEMHEASEPAAPAAAADVPRRYRLILLCVILGCGLGVRLWFGPLIRDDAYITLRYAQRIAEGRGFTFNDGQRVLGTSTPLWTLILATAAGFGAPPAKAAVALGITSDMAAIVLLILLAQRIHGNSAGLLAGAIYSLLPPVIAHAVSGMETSLYLACILAAFLSFEKGRPIATAVFCAFVTLIRPDGILVPLSLAIAAGMRSNPERGRFSRRALLPFLVFCLMIAPWALFAWRYFGSIVPQSLIAKQDLGIGFTQSLRLFAAYYSDLYGGWSFAIPVLALLGLAAGFRDRAAAAPFLLWNALYVGAFLAASKFVYPLWPFEWYFLPPLLLYSLSAAAGARFLAGGISRLLRSTPRLAMCAGIVMLAVLAIDCGRCALLQRRVVRMYVKGRELLYLQMAGRLATRIDTAGDLVAAWEIGAFGFAYPGPILDLHGLVSPETVGLGLSKILPGHRPRWLLSWNTSLADEVKDSNWFRQHYRLAAQEINWESRRLQLYRRIDN